MSEAELHQIAHFLFNATLRQIAIATVIGILDGRTILMNLTTPKVDLRDVLFEGLSEKTNVKLNCNTLSYIGLCLWPTVKNFVS